MSSSQKDLTELDSIVDPWKAPPKRNTPSPEVTTDSYVVLHGSGGGVRVFGVRDPKLAADKLITYVKQQLAVHPGDSWGLSLTQSPTLPQLEVQGVYIRVEESASSGVSEHVIGLLAGYLRYLGTKGHRHDEIKPYRG